MPEPRLRVALLTHSVNPRGGVVHVLELGRALHAAGHAVTVIAPAAPGERFFRETPCGVSLAPFVRRAGGFAEQVRQRIDAVHAHVAGLAQRDTIDVWHAHDGIGGNALADLAERGAIAGYLRTVHHVDRFPDNAVQAWETRSIRRASRVLCVSSVWQRRLAEAHGVAAARVHNGIDLARFTPRAGPADAALAARLGLGEGPVVLTVGGIEARKNTRRLVAAFALLRERYPSARLVIAGGASVLDHSEEARAVATEAEAAGLAMRRLPPETAAASTADRAAPILLTGPLPDEAMPALYRHADVLAMPSLLEGFGLAALEALACGTPAVVSAIAPFDEHFADGDVHWADPLDPGSIAAALAAAIAAGRREPPEVCRRHDWAASAARHVELYRDHLAGRPALAA